MNLSPTNTANSVGFQSLARLHMDLELALNTLYDRLAVHGGSASAGQLPLSKDKQDIICLNGCKDGVVQRWNSLTSLYCITQNPGT